ncbi:MAG TPA: DUF6308 family protein [Streptosporangiaceae bacterium]|nr:DUF6308 family protein [Streptosporangiaceae bacterium]
MAGEHNDAREGLRDIKDRAKEARFGAVAAGKLLARKRPDLIPIEESQIAAVFSRKPPDRDERCWNDARLAALDPHQAAGGTSLWRYLARIRDQAGKVTPGAVRPRHHRLDARTPTVTGGTPAYANLPLPLFHAIGTADSACKAPICTLSLRSVAEKDGIHTRLR